MDVFSVPSEGRTGKRFEKDSHGLEILHYAIQASCYANSPAFLMMVACILA